MSDADDRPNVILHPPTLLVVALGGGFILRAIYGGLLPIPEAFGEAAGLILVIAALRVLIASISAFAEAGETLKPDTPSRTLFTEGPYRRSRNPIYAAMIAFGAGFALATQNLWMLLAVAMFGAIVHFFVILPEEAYLSRRFGREYEEYKARVRRWI